LLQPILPIGCQEIHGSILLIGFAGTPPKTVFGGTS
jgi:hypothetical protein